MSCAGVTKRGDPCGNAASSKHRWSRYCHIHQRQGEMHDLKERNRACEALEREEERKEKYLLQQEVVALRRREAQMRQSLERQANAQRSQQHHDAHYPHNYPSIGHVHEAGVMGVVQHGLSSQQVRSMASMGYSEQALCAPPSQIFSETSSEASFGSPAVTQFGVVGQQFSPEQSRKQQSHQSHQSGSSAENVLVHQHDRMVHAMRPSGSVYSTGASQVQSIMAERQAKSVHRMQECVQQFGRVIGEVVYKLEQSFLQVMRPLVQQKHNLPVFKKLSLSMREWFEAGGPRDPQNASLYRPIYVALEAPHFGSGDVQVLMSFFGNSVNVNQAWQIGTKFISDQASGKTGVMFALRLHAEVPFSIWQLFFSQLGLL